MRVSLQPFLAICVAAILFLGGCARPAPGAETSGEAHAVYPAPIPVSPPLVEPEALGEPEFVMRLRFAEPETTTIVLARARRLSAGERTVPTYVWPEGGSLIVTTASILIDEVLCGVPPSKTVDVSYVGGHLGNRWLRTSLMTQDLSPGQQYVLMLTEVDGEYFLVGGKHELLIPVPREPGKYKDFTGREVTKRAILGGCP